jgi:hypothetical protein
MTPVRADVAAPAGPQMPVGAMFIASGCHDDGGLFAASAVGPVAGRCAFYDRQLSEASNAETTAVVTMS